MCGRCTEKQMNRDEKDGWVELLGKQGDGKSLCSSSLFLSSRFSKPTKQFLKGSGLRRNPDLYPFDMLVLYFPPPSTVFNNPVQKIELLSAAFTADSAGCHQRLRQEKLKGTLKSLPKCVRMKQLPAALLVLTPIFLPCVL